jgi:hypothetical protein
MDVNGSPPRIIRPLGAVRTATAQSREKLFPELFGFNDSELSRDSLVDQRIASRALTVSLLTWIGPLSSISTAGLMARPGWGPYRWSSCSTER